MIQLLVGCGITMGIHGIPSDPKNATHVTATIHPVRAQLPNQLVPKGKKVCSSGVPLHSQAETWSISQTQPQMDPNGKMMWDVGCSMNSGRPNRQHHKHRPRNRQPPGARAKHVPWGPRSPRWGCASCPEPRLRWRSRWWPPRMPQIWWDDPQTDRAG